VSQLSMYDVEFRFVKAAAAGTPGNAYQYTFPVRKVRLAAASAHPRDLLSVLNSDLTAPSGTTIEIISSSPVAAVGTEGAILA
jgi:hypothetical protein